jgi:hypothetical protein
VNSSSRVQWRRGLLRLWIVFSILWVVVFLVVTQPWNMVTSYYRAHEEISRISGIIVQIDADILAREEIPNFSDTPASDPLAELRTEAENEQVLQEAIVKVFSQKMFNGALAIVGFPMAVLFLGVSIGWIVSGFRQTGLTIQRKENDV